MDLVLEETARGQALDREQLARLGAVLDEEPKGASTAFTRPQATDAPRDA
jgi:hypothetical protein